MLRSVEYSQKFVELLLVSWFRVARRVREGSVISSAFESFI
jgi:hypothetical protein